MPTPILRGSDDPILQKKTWTFNASSGGSYAEEYRGINLNKMIASWNGVVYKAQSGRMSYANGIAEMQIEWGGNSGGGGGAGDNNSTEVTTDRWECPEPTILVHVFDHPTFLAALDVALAHFGFAVDDTERAQTIAAWTAAASSGKQFVEFVKGTGWASFVAGHPTEASYMARMYQKAAIGQQWQTTLYSCRHTTNAPNGWGLNRADIGVNRIYSQAQFISEVTDSSLWYFPMPGRIQYKLAAAYSNFSAITPARYYYNIGWLKGASGEATAARGRIEISTNYVLNQWSTDLTPAF